MRSERLHQVPWTREEEQRLAALLSAGEIVRNIAEPFGRSRGAIHTKAPARGAMPKRCTRNWSRASVEGEVQTSS